MGWQIERDESEILVSVHTDENSEVRTKNFSTIDHHSDCCANYQSHSIASRITVLTVLIVASKFYIVGIVTNTTSYVYQKSHQII